MSKYGDRIAMDPALRSGKPCIQGTRVAVQDMLEYLAGGMSDQDIVNDFPEITVGDIRAALAFAAQRERQTKTIR